MEYQWVTTELPTGSGPPDPERETAAPTAIGNGGNRGHGDAEHDEHKARGGRRASLRLVPIWSDDRAFVGWLTAGEAALLQGGLRA